MDVKIEGDVLVIRIACNVTNPPTSASGKSRVVASTRGNKVTGLEIDGKPLTIGLNAYISNG